MHKHLTKFCFLVIVIASSATASATVMYNYDRGAGVFGGSSQLSYDSVSATFDTDTDEFTFAVDYNGNAAEGGWLVISPGPNPKNSNSELGIAYFDATSGNTWIYAYNGQNNNASYQTMEFLGFFEDAYTSVGDEATLAFDATAVNAGLDTGFAFGNHIGIWFHPTANLNVLGDSDGLYIFQAHQNGWLDTNFGGDCSKPNTGCVTTVPEPSTWLLMLVGIALLMWTRSRKTVEISTCYADLSARIDRQLYSSK